MSSDDENKDEDIRKMKGEFAEQYKRHSELQAMSDEEFAEAAGDNDFKRQQKAAIEAEVAKGDSRFDNWGSKAKAAKAAGITRPTLDAWIASKKIPERYLRDITPVGAKKKKYEVNINGIIRIAEEKKFGRSGRPMYDISKFERAVELKRYKDFTRTHNELVPLDNLDKLEKVINLIAKIRSL